MKRLENLAKKRGESKYKTGQFLIEKGLEKQRTYETNLTISFWFLCYALIVATILLVVF